MLSIWSLPAISSNIFPNKLELAATLVEARPCLRSCGRLAAVGLKIKYLPDAIGILGTITCHLTEASLAEWMSAAGFHVERIVSPLSSLHDGEGSLFPYVLLARLLAILIDSGFRSIA